MRGRPGDCGGGWRRAAHVERTIGGHCFGEKVSTSGGLGLICEVASAVPPPCGALTRTEVLTAPAHGGLPCPGPCTEKCTCFSSR